jgi:peroxiredoxin
MGRLRGLVEQVRLRPGDPAPAFALPHRPGEVVDLGEHLGADVVVLLFIPFAFSPICTSELCTIRDSWSEWSELAARVFAISVDGPFVTARFRETEDLPFPVLSDFNKDVSRMYGVLVEDSRGLKGVANRAVFVIDRAGRITYAWVCEDMGVEPDYDAIRRAVSEAV